jgi:hypothetical protein
LQAKSTETNARILLKYLTNLMGRNYERKRRNIRMCQRGTTSWLHQSRTCYIGSCDEADSKGSSVYMLRSTMLLSLEISIKRQNISLDNLSMTLHCIEDNEKKRLKTTLDKAIFYKNVKEFKNISIISDIYMILLSVAQCHPWTGSILCTNMTLIVIQSNLFFFSRSVLIITPHLNHYLLVTKIESNSIDDYLNDLQICLFEVFIK